MAIDYFDNKNGFGIRNLLYGSEAQKETLLGAMQKSSEMVRKRLQPLRIGIMEIGTEREAYRLLAGRLKIKEGQTFPVDHLSLFVTDTQALVFIVNKNQYVVIEDDPNMFPSDKLITQLRLLLG